MTITVEDGTGVANAETYADVAFCGQFHTDRGNASWAAAASDAVREAAIRRGMAYLEGVYRDRWKGSKRWPYSTNALAWPRAGVFDSEGLLIVEHEAIPVALKQAVAVAALRELDEPGSLAPDEDRGGAVRQIQAGSVGITYAPNAPVGVVRKEIGHLLSLLVDNGGSTIPLRRS